jgi:hypothetical protein
MKKYLILISIILGLINARAQVTLEHVYDSASTLAMGTPALEDQLEIVNFSVSGERYVKINRHGEKIMIYNLNHTLIETIDYSGFPQPVTIGDDNYIFISYLSENLFDMSSTIEFMYTVNVSGSPYYTGIYKDNGTLIFSDTGVALTVAEWPPQQYPIYNTSQGTKMILSYSNMQAKVFSLGGTLTSCCDEENIKLLAMQKQSGISNAYPNPNNGSTKIDYMLPDGVNEGEIVFYNLQGMEVKRFKVDRTFNTLLISTKDIAAGTYYYQLQTSVGNSGGKKMVVIK